MLKRPIFCHPHRTGVSPKTPPFFNASCPACQKKLAAGLVTGKEPPAPSFAGWLIKPKNRKHEEATQ